jgi:hypothetical protein
MACQNTANRTSAAGLNFGVTKLAGKAAYASGVALSAAAGGLLGAGLGTALAGPAGGVAGGLGGAYLGGRRGVKRQQRRLAAADEKRWQQSSAGQKAIRAQEQTLAPVVRAYQAKTTRFKQQRDQVEQAYEAARTEWLRQQQEQVTGLAKITHSPRAMGVAAAVGGAAAGVAARYALSRAGGSSFDLPGTTTSAALTAALSAPQAVEKVREQRWQESPAGQQARARQQRALANLKLRQSRLKQQFETQKQAIERKYELARAKFLEEKT